jgi:hypothetical protein
MSLSALAMARRLNRMPMDPRAPPIIGGMSLSALAMARRLNRMPMDPRAPPST